MTYIVTGACGYVGGAIVKELAARGVQTRCLVLPGEEYSHICMPGVKIFFGDITQPGSLQDIFSSSDSLTVIHAAGMVSVETRVSRELYRINVEGTRSIISLCERKNAKLIYIGSVDAVPPINGIVEEAHYDPQAVYGAYAKTKAEAAMLVLESAKKGFDALILLPCAIFGPYDYKGGLVSSLVKMYLRRFPLPIIKGGYEFVDVRDVAAAAISAAEKGRSGESYILSNRFFELRDIVREMREMRGLRPIRITLPNVMAKAAGFLLEHFCILFKKKPLFTAYTVTCVNTRVKYSSALAKADLGYSARPFSETLRDTVAFMQSQGFLK